GDAEAVLPNCSSTPPSAPTPNGAQSIHPGRGTRDEGETMNYDADLSRLIAEQLAAVANADAELTD
ncbi:hypothetical protein ACC691_40040, partial [Rhizobium johnstonii]|uniref:hypothetical protein n=1 Tax=Rhizobium johnstonii TaxID=3019933 RepID=UPI003F99D2CE